MKKIWKIGAGVAALGLVVLLVGTGLVVNSLPGPASLARAVKGPPAGATPALTKAPSAETLSPSGKLQAEEAPEETEKEKKKREEAQLMALIDEPRDDIRVCENLGKAPVLGKKELKNLEFADLFSEKSRGDSLAEALRVPIKAVFQDTEFAGFMHDFLDVDTSGMEKAERDSFLSKLGFYTRATMLVGHLVARKHDFETLGDRAMNLHALAKLAQKKPELAQDPAVLSACEALERSLGAGEETDAKTERQQIVALIKEQGLTPKDLDFDPDSYMNFQMQKTDKGLSFGLSDHGDKK